MKKLFLLLTMVAMLATSCTEGGIDENDKPQNPTEQPGGGGNDDGGGDSGDNNDNDNQEGDGNEGGGDGADTPIEEAVFIIDSDGNYVVEYGGGIIKVEVTTNLEYSVDIPNDAQPWLSVADTRAIRNETLTFTIAKNETTKERQATVTIKDAEGEELQSIVFKQKFNEDDESTGGPISVSKGRVSFDFEGGECELSVDAEFSWVATCPAEWVALQTPDGIAGKEPLKFTVGRNTTLNERKATITLKNENYNLVQEVYIIQTEFTPVIKTVESVSLDYLACEKFIEVTSNVEYDAVDDADWLTCEVVEGGVNLSAIANGALDTRSAQVFVVAKENPEALSIKVTVVQASTSIQYSIFYTSSDGKIVSPYKQDVFGANIASNTYRDGQGVIIFDAPVTSIGEKAFYKCTSLTSVTIPNGVTSIGNWAFDECTLLTSVTIPDSVTSIGVSAFDECTSLKRVDITDLSAWCKISFENDAANPLCCGKKLYLNGSELTDITIPSDITEIKNYTFYNCKSLTSVTIPDGVTSIGNDAFEDCTSLTSVTIPDSVTSIGSRAFAECTSLTSETIGDSVTSIGVGAFSGCTGEIIINSKIIETDYTSRPGWLSGSEFTKLTIGDNITKIGDYVFYKCTSLTSVTIPDSVTSIGRDAFQNCDSLKDTYVNITDLASYSTSNPMHNMGGNKHLLVNGTEITELLIPDSVTSIGNYAFYRCTSLTSVTIPNSVTSIGNRAFQGTSLTSVTIGNDVTSIGEYAFSGCTGEIIINSKIIETDYTRRPGWLSGSKFTKLTIGDNITKIGDYVFYDYTSLTSVTIPDSVTSIGGDAFKYCTSLKDTYVNITDLAAYSTSNPMHNMGGNKHLLVNGTEITELLIPDSVTSIGVGAFYGCSSLTSVTIPDSVTSIGGSAFYKCTSLTSITIPNRVTSIGGRAFYGCTSLTGVTIPDSVTSIGKYAFEDCTSLKSVTIGNGVTSIGDSAFSGCTGELVINSKIVETDYTGSDYPMYNSSSWLYGSKFTKLTIGDNITKIGDYAFYKCTSLTSVTIPDSVTSIGGKAFDECTSLKYRYVNITDLASYSTSNPMHNIVGNKHLLVNGTEITELVIPDGVTSIGEYAFYNCSSLTSVTIPDSVTSIGGSAFYKCTSLTSITIPNRVTSIGGRAFYGCSSLTSVKIGNSVTSIGEFAFCYCPSLASVTIGNSVTSIGGSAFYNCTSLTSVTIPDSVTSIENLAFSACPSLASVTIGNSVTSIGKYAFSSCTGELVINSKIVETDYTGSNYPMDDDSGWLSGSKFTKLTIGDNITKIGDCVFYYCTSLTSVTIPDSVTSIGGDAFNGCTSLKDTYVNITDLAAYSTSNPMHNMGGNKHLLVNGTEITELVIPDSVTSIGDDAFRGCTSLTSATIGNGVTSIGGYAFYNCTGELIINSKIIETDYTSSPGWLSGSKFTKLTIGDNITKIGDYVFYDYTSLTSVTIPDSVTSIGDAAFRGCTSLTSITIPDSVTSIGDSAISSCTSLTTITIPNSVTSIGGSAFYKCTSLTSVTIGNSVTSIGIAAFYGCDSLTSVTIPDSITSIGVGAFSDCTSLKEVYCKPTTPPTGGSYIFDNNASGRKIYVPTASVDAYKAATYWEDYASYIYGYDF